MPERKPVGLLSRWVFVQALVNINAALDGLKFSPMAGYSGSASVQIETNDQGHSGSGGAASDSDTVSMTINPVAVPNNAPTFTSTPVTEATEGSLYIYNITTADAEGDTVTITHEGELPSWLTLPTGSGDSKTLVGQPGASDAAGSPYTIILRVTDAIGDFTEQEFTLTVINVNNAPVLDLSGDMSLTAIDEDTTDADNTGTLVSAIIASAGANLITDADSGALTGIAVIAVDNSNGTWQYDKDGGSNFTAFPAVAENQAVLLDGGAKIRFVPNANYFGTVDVGISFRAWDGTSGANGDTNVDTTTNGGTTAFSSATETAAIIVNAINDLPVFTSTAITEATPETPYNYTVTASDVENAGSDLKFSGITLPAWLTLTDNQDGTATLGGTPSQSEVGTHPVAVQVTDANSVNAAAPHDFSINVIGQPVLEALTLTVNPASFSEKAGAAVSTGTVTRPNTSGVLLITLESSDSSEVTVPQTVEIPDTQPSVTFSIDAVDDEITDGTQAVTLTASATGYTNGTTTVSVTDNDVDVVVPPSPPVITPPAPQPKLTVEKDGEGTVTSEQVGIDCGEDCSEAYNSGTVVTLSATPESGWQFQAWEGDCDDSGSDTTSDATSNNTVTLTMNANQTCKANFVPTLTVEKAGDGTVTSEPEGIDCPEDCSEAYNKDTEVTLTATPEAGWALKGWEGDCQGTGSDTTSNSTVAVTMDSNKTCKASFAALPTTLTVEKDGDGTVTSEPKGIDCGEDYSEAYDKDTEVTLTATPEAGWALKGWEGDCQGTGSDTTSNSTVAVTMDSNKTCKASFALLPTTLTVEKDGEGTVTSEPAGIDCGEDCSEAYDKDTEVTLTATPEAGWELKGWEGDCQGTDSDTTSNSLVAVTMDTDKTCKASFAVQSIQLSLTVDKVGEGTITSEPEGINCGTDCSAEFAEKTALTLTAAPAAMPLS